MRTHIDRHLSSEDIESVLIFSTFLKSIGFGYILQIFVTINDSLANAII